MSCGWKSGNWFHDGWYGEWLAFHRILAGNVTLNYLYIIHICTFKTTTKLSMPFKVWHCSYMCTYENKAFMPFGAACKLFPSHFDQLSNLLPWFLNWTTSFCNWKQTNQLKNWMISLHSRYANRTRSHIVASNFIFAQQANNLRYEQWTYFFILGMVSW